MKGFRNFLVSTGTVLFLVISADGQTWTLDQCLSHARKNNLTIEAAQMDKINQTFDRKEANQARFPNLFGSTGLNYNFGRNIDPTTNDFVPQTLGFNSINVNSNMILFNGGRLRKEFQRAQLAENQFEAVYQQTVQDVELDVIVAFLNVLFETERKANAEEQLSLAQQQLDRVQQLVEVEMAPEADTYEWTAQIAASEQGIMASDNLIQNNLFLLRNLLNIDPADPFDIVLPEVPQDLTTSEVYNYNEIYSSILSHRPELQALQFGEQVAERDIDIAKTAYLPTLFIGGALTTNFSTLSQTFEDFSVQRIASDGIYINGESVLFEEDINIPATSFRTPYFTQLDQNLGFGIGVQVNIPIYDRSVRKFNVQRAENALLQARNSNQQAIRTLEQQVQQIITDLTNAEKQYVAGQRRVEFLRNAYDNMIQRYELGMSNNYDLLDAQNQYNQAVNDLTLAKYDLIFRQQILDFYMGNPIGMTN